MTENLQIRQSYEYAVARIRQAENRLLDRSRITRMLDARTAQDVLRILAETEYSEAIGDLPADDYESVLARELERTYSFVSEFVPDDRIVTLFRMGYDLHNCKVAFRTHHLGIEGQDVWSALGTVPAHEIRRAVAEEIDLAEFPHHVARLLRMGFARLSERQDDRTPVEVPGTQKPDRHAMDPQDLDMTLDKEYFASVLAIADSIDSAFVLDLCKSRIDLANMTGFLRCRRLRRDRRFFGAFFVPDGHLPFDVFYEVYEEPIDSWTRKMAFSRYHRLVAQWSAESDREDSIAAFERLGRDYVLELSRAAKFEFFGPEPIVAYLLAKETEVSDLRAIFVGKVNGLDAELIRERLSGAYA